MSKIKLFKNPVWRNPTLLLTLLLTLTPNPNPRGGQANPRWTILIIKFNVQGVQGAVFVLFK